MSSMTEEEIKEYKNEMFKNETLPRFKISDFWSSVCYCDIDWLNAHHFDYRGLIEKGLAFEAKEGMYEY